MPSLMLSTDASSAALLGPPTTSPLSGPLVRMVKSSIRRDAHPSDLYPQVINDCETGTLLVVVAMASLMLSTGASSAALLGPPTTSPLSGPLVHMARSSIQRDGASLSMRPNPLATAVTDTGAAARVMAAATTSAASSTMVDAMEAVATASSTTNCLYMNFCIEFQ
ncbi:hypothetical protein CRG98_002791 [Punica granatum]|uniref:Uncharacterized protein n=1 Tax=Punica granatum TaxID=22663 RepID=A0A2I0L7Y5_PUNGR|nr:hypothetical protein CRG98_002791 [Punica granatum]